MDDLKLEEARELILKYVRGDEPRDVVRPGWWRGIGVFNLDGVDCIKINIRGKEDEAQAWDLVVEALGDRSDLRSEVKFLFDPVGDIVAHRAPPETRSEALSRAVEECPFGDSPLFRAGFEAGWEAAWRAK